MPSLRYLIEEMRIKSARWDRDDDSLKRLGLSNREEHGIAEFLHGITCVPVEWVLPYLEELLEIHEQGKNPYEEKAK